jgi:hypothetical protein
MKWQGITRRITSIILIVGIFALIIWDIIAAITPGDRDTISEYTRDYSVYPVLPAALGGLCGHFFFWEIRVIPEIWGLVASVSFLIALGVWSVLVKNQVCPQWLISAHMFCSKHSSFVCAFSFVLGGLFWGLPQSSKTI